MDSGLTEYQSNEDERKARQLSLHHTQPPTRVPGYELTQFLGSGAYGEVWIGLDRTTGRKVAVKFYRHRGGVDWTLLSREVEKLVFLSADRYVVQLLDVGWDADPPYYVMEYVENGSLDELLQREGPLPAAEAAELFRETAIGLNHAHAKGVLHCDLKPANVLLDQDGRPRLADFGQSRLSHEQTPSLGTLFYMAPEQADLEAVPDAQWDVYALGAILYCMLVGKPPFHDEEILERIQAADELSERLQVYRQWIASSGRANEHRQVAGVDNALAEIVDRCLAVRSSQRFANVQEVLNALQSRAQARLRRPLLLLGIVGPLLLMVVMVVFGWRGYHRALRDSDEAVTAKVVENNALAAKFVSGSVTTEINRYFQAVDHVAADTELNDLLAEVSDKLRPMLIRLADADASNEELEPLRETFRREATRQPLQQKIESLMTDRQLPKAASWFVCDRRGTQLAAVFNRKTKPTIGKNYAFRTYCHGGLKDLDPNTRPLPDQHVRRTQLSAPLRSTATNTLKLAVSTPLYEPGEPGRFLGVLVLTVEVGDFLTFAATSTQFAVLVDTRDNGFQGVILYHPLFTKVFHEKGEVPEQFSRYRVELDGNTRGDREYRDPLGQVWEGRQYDRAWIAARAEVEMPVGYAAKTENRSGSGLIVLIQEDKEAAMLPVRQLGKRLANEGLFAVGGILLVVFLLWYFVLRVVGAPALWSHVPLGSTLSANRPTPSQPQTTVMVDHAKRGRSGQSSDD